MTKVTHDTTAERYLITVDGRDAGYADYIQGDGVRQGLSNPLIQAALDDTRAAGDKVRPLCSAVAGFIEKHPEYQDLVQP